MPVELRGTIISVDDTIRKGTTAEGLSKLKPAFPAWGEASSTGGNSSGLGDGAALCILTTRKRAEKEGMEIIGKYVATSFVGTSPYAPLTARILTGSCRCGAKIHGDCSSSCDTESP